MDRKFWVSKTETDYAVGEGNQEILRTDRETAHLLASAPELLSLAKEFQGFYETFGMQDMTSEELRGELDPDVFKKVIATRTRIAKIIAKAEGRS